MPKNKKPIQTQIPLAFDNTNVFYRHLAELTPEVVVIHTNDKIVYANPAAYRFVGATTKKQIIGQPIMKFIHKDSVKLVEQRRTMILSTKKPAPQVEEKFINLRGETVHAEITSVPFIFQSKLSILTILHDITEQKLAEERIKRSEERFRALIKYGSDAILLLSREGIIMYASDSVYSVAGYQPKDVVGQKVIAFISPDQHDKFLQIHSQVTKHPGEYVTVQYKVRHKNGNWIWIEATGVNYFNQPHIEAIVVNFRDITKRRETEKKLWETNETLQTIIQASPLAVYVVDTKGKVIIWNKTCEVLFGWTLEEIKDKILPIVPKEYKFEFKQLMQLLLSGKSFTKETRRQRKDGEWIDVSISAAPVVDETGKIKNIVAITSDISERKDQERHKDAFMGIVSHELKTPVTSLKAYEQVLQQRFIKIGDEASAAFLYKMDNQINKLTNLINDLLDVTKIEGGKLQFTDEYFALDELLQEIIEEVQRTTQTHMIIKEGECNKTLFGDRYRIGQVLMNLLTNAIKYSPQANRVIVRSSGNEHEVTISVEDFGVGVTKKMLPHVFERYFRESGPKEDTFPGLGLGLYISSEIISRQGGKIWATSEKGKGATFSFSLPIRSQ